MKKLLLLLLTLVMIFPGCKEVDSDASLQLSGTTIVVTMPTTKTSLGEKIDGEYPVFWSEEDKLVVNGKASTSIAIADGGTTATFNFANSVLSYPYHITYPYTEGSLCENERATVVFSAKQDYVENTFGVGYSPMCGYSEREGVVSLKQLSGVLRLAIKGNAKISKIEVVAAEGVAVAGEFDVDCQSGTLAAIEGKTSNKITYTANQKLSTDAAKIFYIVVPAGNLGECHIVLTDENGMFMDLKWNATNVKQGVVREFKELTFSPGISVVLEGFKSEEDEFIIDSPTTPKPANNEVWYTSTIDIPESVWEYDNRLNSHIISDVWDAKTGKGVLTFDGNVTVSPIFSNDAWMMWCYSNGLSEDQSQPPLTSVILPGCVTTIPTIAFLDSRNLISITIPESVTSIENYAFHYCESLASVTIPDSVTSIGESAFRGCTSLKEVYCKPTTPPTVNSDMFGNNASGRKIYVPRNSVEAYKAASYWSDYASAIEGYDF